MVEHEAARWMRSRSDGRSRGVLVVGVAMVVVLGSGHLNGRNVFAHGQLDQVNNPPATTTYSCGAGGVPLMQSFTPAVGQVVAVDLYLRAGGAFPPDGMDLDVRLLAADGRELGAATTRMAGPVAAGRVVTAHFDFAAPVAVVAGTAYRLAWETVVPSELSWLGADGDPYPRGEAYSCADQAVTGRDYNFATYGPGIVTPSASPLPTTPVPATATALPPTMTPAPLDAVCPQIRTKVPEVELVAAVANPYRIEGYRQLERPSQPPSPYNKLRTWLTIRRISLPYDRFWNGLVWRAGCP